MRVFPVTDRARLRAYFARDPGLHIYELGDLDDFYWPNTRWFGLGGDELDAAVLLYVAGNAAAIGCYAALGFVEVGRFEEHVLAKR